MRKEAEEQGQQLRHEVGTKVQEFGDSLQKLVGELGKSQNKRSKRLRRVTHRHSQVHNANHAQAGQ